MNLFNKMIMLVSKSPLIDSPVNFISYEQARINLIFINIMKSLIFVIPILIIVIVGIIFLLKALKKKQNHRDKEK